MAHRLLAPGVRSPASLIVTTALGLIIFALSGFGITVEELESAPRLTPASFASHFRTFEFCYRDQVQSPEVFLQTRSGDCDDYATLAAVVLAKHGYSPRLIAVRMPNVVHVVCYIPETRSYLDYNVRGQSPGLIECGSRIQEIARSVARSYGAKWNSASEFTFEKGAKRLVETVLERRERHFASR
jgi:hypothetical protein